MSVKVPVRFERRMEFSLDTLNFGVAVGKILNLSVEEALNSPDPIIQALIFLDKKLGKRRLQKVDSRELHEFPKITYALRCKMEGLEIDKPSGS